MQLEELSSYGTLLPPPHTSWAQVMSMLDERDRADLLKKLTDEEKASILDDWRFIGRREQLPPAGEWLVWLILAGRGFGKTRSGAEWIIDQHKNRGKRTTGIIAATTEDLKRYCLRGRSGILSVAPKHFYPDYQPANTRLVWPNGAETLFFTGERPERLRGPNLEAAWCDELASWQYLDDTWDNLDFALRESETPQRVITTTPRPRKLLRQIRVDSETVVTGGSTYDNQANLARSWFDRLRKRYEGTEKGRQEIHAMILDEAEGALWKRAWIEKNRLPVPPESIVREVVAIDPAASKTEDSAETGIIRAGVSHQQRGYVLDDLSDRLSPGEWARRALTAWDFHNCACIVAEANNGGEMVRYTIQMTAREMKREGLIRTADVPVMIVHASKGKDARAEPVAALYEQNRVHHIGEFNELEDQLVTWEPASNVKSPDRLDAVVWALTYLLVHDVGAVEGIGITGESKSSYWRGAA